MSVQTLPSDLPSSRQEILRQHNELQRHREELIRLQRELEYYKEQLKLMRHRYFGRSSERRVPEGESRQVALFTSDPEPAPVPVEKEKITHCELSNVLPAACASIEAHRNRQKVLWIYELKAFPVQIVEPQKWAN